MYDACTVLVFLCSCVRAGALSCPVPVACTVYRVVSSVYRDVPVHIVVVPVHIVSMPVHIVDIPVHIVSMSIWSFARYTMAMS